MEIPYLSTTHSVPVLMGAELNILDFEGHVDLDEYYLKKIDYAVASLHTPCIDNNGSVADYTRAYLNVLENPYVNIIGHPDDSRLPADWTEVAKAAARNHKLLEVNNTSLNPLGARKGAKDNYKELLEKGKNSNGEEVFSEMLDDLLYLAELIDFMGITSCLAARRTLSERLTDKLTDSIAGLADEVLEKWENYQDKAE